MRRRGGGVPGGGGGAVAGHRVLALQLEVGPLHRHRLVLRLQLYAAVRLRRRRHPPPVPPVAQTAQIPASFAGRELGSEEAAVQKQLAFDR